MAISSSRQTSPGPSERSADPVLPRGPANQERALRQRVLGEPRHGSARVGHPVHELFSARQPQCVRHPVLVLQHEAFAPPPVRPL